MKIIREMNSVQLLKIKFLTLFSITLIYILIHQIYYKDTYDIVLGTLYYINSVNND